MWVIWHKMMPYSHLRFRYNEYRECGPSRSAKTYGGCLRFGSYPFMTLSLKFILLADQVDMSWLVLISLLSELRKSVPYNHAWYVSDGVQGSGTLSIA